MGAWLEIIGSRRCARRAELSSAFVGDFRFLSLDFGFNGSLMGILSAGLGKMVVNLWCKSTRNRGEVVVIGG